MRAFQALGLLLGSGSGSDTLHYLLEDAWVRGSAGLELSDTFLTGAQSKLSFADAPLYAVLHESIYGQRSVDPGPTGWAAEQVRSEFPEFDAARALEDGAPVRFTGEMIYPWMFETDPALRPLQETADLLAKRTDWPDLYALTPWRPTRSRWPPPSTTTTCTSTPRTPWRPPTRSAACGPG